MSFEPRGKVAVLLDAMRAQPDKIVWPANDVAQTMEVARGNLPAYLRASITHGMLHSKVDNGKSFFSLKPFPSNTGAGLGPKLLPSPEYSAEERAAALADTRAPKSDPRWSPPKMVCARGEVAAPMPPPGKTEVKMERLRADIQAEMEPRTDRGNRLLLDKLKTSLPHWDADAQGHSGKGTPSAAPPAPIRTRPPAPQPEQPEPEAEAAEEAEAVEFNAALWLDGDLVLYGLTELEDGGHLIRRDDLVKLRRLTAWMPC